MEQDAEHLLSPLLTKPRIQKQLEQLEKVMKEAQKRVDYTMAHDPEILKAINIVERFLRKKKRPCYGGQAINALLPKERQFYDKKFNIPTVYPDHATAPLLRTLLTHPLIQKP